MGKLARLGTLVIVILVAGSANARDCSSPTESRACASNADCGCGTNTASAQCEVAATECVSGETCDRFCRGSDYSLSALCRAGECIRARLTRCPGDCDGDARVIVNELVTGVTIALEEAPLAACTSFDADGNGAIVVDELVGGVNAGLSGCAAAVRFPGLSGIYDASVRYPEHPEVSADAVGEVFDNEDRGRVLIRIRPNFVVDVTATANPDGSMALEGYYLVTDIGYGVRGTAFRHDEAGEERIEGSLYSTSGFASHSVPDTFTLRRASASDVERFNGSYTFAMSRTPSDRSFSPSMLTLTLDVGPTGIALSSAGADVTEDGTVGRVTSGECHIAPEGHVYCAMLYLLEDSLLSTTLRFTGVLPAAVGATSQGSFLAGYDPPFGPEPYVSGQWTATRE